MPIQRRAITGVDIGSSTVKLVHCAGAKGWRTGVAALPDGVMAGNHINSAKLLATTIKKAQTAGHIGSGSAALCLSGADVIIRQAVMPRMNAEQLKQNVIDEISSYLSVDPAMYVIDYKVQDVLTDNAATQYRLMIVAVPKSVVQPYIQALSMAGFKVISVDVAANAKEKLVNFLTGRKGNYAVVDMGMSATGIDTYLAGRYFVSKTSATCLAAAAAALAKAMDTDPLRAFDMIMDNDPAPACRQALNDYVDQMTSDAMRVIDYFRSRNQRTPVEQVYICGGGARVPGIAQMMQERLNLPVQDMGGMLESVLSSRDAAAPRLAQYASAAGAALTEVD